MVLGCELPPVPAPGRHGNWVQSPHRPPRSVLFAASLTPSDKLLGMELTLTGRHNNIIYNQGLTGL